MVSLTSRAAEAIRNRKNGNRYIRILKDPVDKEVPIYEISFTDEVNRDDILYLSYGIKILVDQSTRKFFENLNVDYNGRNGSGAFTFSSYNTLGTGL